MTYKQIVINSIERQIFIHLSKVCEDRYFTINRVDTRQDGNQILFNVHIEAKIAKGAPFTNPYIIHGYVSNYGDAVMCSINYERTFSEINENGEPKTRYFYKYGLEMKAFKFDE